jgi:hypothetical protein
MIAGLRLGLRAGQIRCHCGVALRETSGLEQIT